MKAIAVGQCGRRPQVVTSEYEEAIAVGSMRPKAAVEASEYEGYRCRFNAAEGRR